MTTAYKIYTHAEKQPGQGIRAPEYTPDAWDAFVEQDTVFVSYWEELLATFPEYTFYICNNDNMLLTSATAVPLYFADDLTLLPNGGWRWVVETALATKAKKQRANLVSALGIHVVPSERGRGLSKMALRWMCQAAHERGFDRLIAPVRPSQKHRYPLISMEDYISWKRDDGYCFDAWLRTHQRLGAVIIKVATASMIVRGTVAQWERWTNLPLPGSGQHIVAGAVNPIRIDRERDEGTYIEPNVWMCHDLDSYAT